MNKRYAEFAIFWSSMEYACRICVRFYSTANCSVEFCLLTGISATGKEIWLANWFWVFLYGVESVLLNRLYLPMVFNFLNFCWFAYFLLLCCYSFLCCHDFNSPCASNHCFGFLVPNSNVSLGFLSANLVLQIMNFCRGGVYWLLNTLTAWASFHVLSACYNQSSVEQCPVLISLFRSILRFTLLNNQFQLPWIIFQFPNIILFRLSFNLLSFGMFVLLN